MKQLARTLLILGSVTACERAHEESAAPRVQPKPAAIAAPLADDRGVPAVGNIGQTGAPTTVQRPRRLQRVVRAVRPPPAPAPALQVQEVQPANPLVDSRQRPAVGNMGRASGMRTREAGE